MMLVLTEVMHFIQLKVEIKLDMAWSGMKSTLIMDEGG